MRLVALVVALSVAGLGAVSSTAAVPEPAAAGWRACDGSFRLTVNGKRWKLDKFRVSSLGCVKAKRIARTCMTSSCPTGWKRKVDYVPGKPPVWWHWVWATSGEVSPPMVQWRVRRAR